MRGTAPFGLSSLVLPTCLLSLWPMVILEVSFFWALIYMAIGSLIMTPLLVRLTYRETWLIVWLIMTACDSEAKRIATARTRAVYFILGYECLRDKMLIN